MKRKIYLKKNPETGRFELPRRFAQPDRLDKDGKLLCRGTPIHDDSVPGPNPGTRPYVIVDIRRRGGHKALRDEGVQ